MARKTMALVLALVLILAALPAMGMADAAATTTISLWGWQGELEDAWLNHLIPDFEAANPNVNVDLVLMPWSQYWQKIQTGVISGGLPDLMIMSVAYVDVYAKNGSLLNLKERIQADIDADLYYESGLKTVRWPDAETGDEYAFPWNVVGNCLYYNKTLFDEAGIAYPDDTWTWDMLRETAIKLTKDTGNPDDSTWGFAVDNGYTTVDSLIYSFGGSIVADDLKTCTINTPEAAKALTFLHDLIHVDKVSPMPLASSDTMAFASGRVAMELGGAWSLESFGNTTSFDWDVAKMPIGPVGARKPRAWSDSIAISATSQHPDEAWAFIRFMISDQGQIMENLSGTRIPILKSASVSDNWLEPGSVPEHKNLLIESLEEASPFVFRGGWAEWNSIYESETFLAITGEKSVEDALRDAEIGVQEVLDSNQ